MILTQCLLLRNTHDQKLKLFDPMNYVLTTNHFKNSLSLNLKIVKQIKQTPIVLFSINAE